MKYLITILCLTALFFDINAQGQKRKQWHYAEGHDIVISDTTGRFKYVHLDSLFLVLQDPDSLHSFYNRLGRYRVTYNVRVKPTPTPLFGGSQILSLILFSA